jgi:hypothetical protein
MMELVKRKIENTIQYDEGLIEIIESELAKKDIRQEYRERLLTDKYNLLNKIDRLKAELEELQ